VSIDPKNPIDAEPPEALRAAIGALRANLDRQSYPGEAWASAVRRRRAMLWRGAGLAAAAAVFLVAALLVADGLGTRSRLPTTRPPAADSLTLVQVPLSSSLDPCLGGGMPNESLTLPMVVLTENGKQEIFFPPTWMEP
jgi:hypothetical protein